MYDLNKLNYLLTNTVLCQTLLKDGTTGNPKEEVIEQCKINCFKIIERDYRRAGFFPSNKRIASPTGVGV